jgi:Glycosyl transferase family 11
MELRGRLGNQLFQFATGMGSARRVDAPLYYSSQWPDGEILLPGLVDSTYREATTADLIRLGAKRSQHRHVETVAPVWRRTARGVHRVVHQSPAIIEELDDESNTVQERFFRPDVPVVLRGYFQSEGYFADCAAEVNAAIHLPDVAGLLPPDLPRPVVGVSFRRGDYNSLGWALPLDYYRNALAQLAERVELGTILITGDDRAFLELVAPLVAPYAQRVVNATELDRSAMSQLAVLASTDHSVVANSSFSWWGAWLAEHRSVDGEHLVFSPKGWILGKECAPERWIKVGWDE